MTKTIFLIAICILATQCSTQKKVEYNIPPDVGEPNRSLLVQRFEKGKILYKIHCSDCHGIYTKGKDSVPNFTKQQIDNYTAIALADPVNHTVIKKISSEQLDYILTFLRLKKKGT
ncbi:MAG TPA: hypothetical protein VH396_17925 [Chitinophagaceae bacterium]|jgi:hypothetical protein